MSDRHYYPQFIVKAMYGRLFHVTAMSKEDAVNAVVEGGLGDNTAQVEELHIDRYPGNVVELWPPHWNTLLGTHKSGVMPWYLVLVLPFLVVWEWIKWIFGVSPPRSPGGKK